MKTLNFIFHNDHSDQEQYEDNCKGIWSKSMNWGFAWQTNSSWTNYIANIEVMPSFPNSFLTSKSHHFQELQKCEYDYCKVTWGDRRSSPILKKDVWTAESRMGEHWKNEDRRIFNIHVL